jgi:D-tyrosyl-tRNA(Tyr) deacylase
MTAFEESTHTGEFILSEGNGTISRDNVTVTVPADTTLAAGAVLAYSGGYYVPVTKSLVDADAALGILYAPLTNADDEPANLVGVIVNKLAEVRGAALDWNAAVQAVQEDAIDLCTAQALIVRDYTPPADGS